MRFPGILLRSIRAGQAGGSAGRAIVRLALVAFAMAGSLMIYVIYLLCSSLPTLDGTQKMEGLHAGASVEFDAFGIPRIHAQTRPDVFRVLGFVTAGDRFFQMDLLRRQAAGSLSEVLGPSTLDSDRWRRVMGFQQIASEILQTLPSDQREVLRAYAEGVNQAIAQFQVLPFEFLLLGYRPAPWRLEDSLLVVLEMYADLSWSRYKEKRERDSTLMESVLPLEVTAFFTPKTDPFTENLPGENHPRSPVAAPVSMPSEPPIPTEALADILREAAVGSSPSPGDIGSEERRGSNAWVVGHSKTRDGRAILANDMHLDLGVPNIWYRAELHYGEVHLAGLTLPGVPLIVTGSNRQIAWGLTSSEVDAADLILVEIDPRNPTEYRTSQGTRHFGIRTETIQIKGQTDETIQVRTTEWGPVLPDPLLGKPVAVRWTAFDPLSTNLDYMNLDRVSSVQEALPLLNRTGGPPLNVLVADADGNIGWTLTGRIPIRFGMEGMFARSWADGNAGWRGYIAPDEMPRIFNPASGFIVNANQRMVDFRYPYLIGHNGAAGYRASRIAERLKQMEGITEKDLLALQLDTRADFYRDYLEIALRVLETAETETEPDKTGLRRQMQSYLQTWDGQAEPGSSGLAVLVEFRKELMEVVFSPLLALCRSIDPGCDYPWSYPDVPLQRLLDAKIPELLPRQRTYSDWDVLVRSALERSAQRLMERHHAPSMDWLTWGRMDEDRISHPLSGAIPLLGYLLDMPQQPLPGCAHCVRLARNGGATERLVVSPGHDEEGILHMPAGQSGHPLSSHYGDQHQSWVEGLPIPLWAGPARHTLTFEPEKIMEGRPDAP